MKSGGNGVLRSLWPGSCGIFLPAPSAPAQGTFDFEPQTSSWFFCGLFTSVRLFVTLTGPKACSLVSRWKTFPKPGQAWEPGAALLLCRGDARPACPLPPPYIPHSIAALPVFNFPLQLTETSSRYARKISAPPPSRRPWRRSSSTLSAAGRTGSREGGGGQGHEPCGGDRAGARPWPGWTTTRWSLAPTLWWRWWRVLGWSCCGVGDGVSDWGRRLGSIAGAANPGSWSLACWNEHSYLCWACLKAVPWVPVCTIVKVRFCSSWACSLFGLCIQASRPMCCQMRLKHQDLSSGCNSGL